MHLSVLSFITVLMKKVLGFAQPLATTVRVTEQTKRGRLLLPRVSVLNKSSALGSVFPLAVLWNLKCHGFKIEEEVNSSSSSFIEGLTCALYITDLRNNFDILVLYLQECLSL